MKILIDENLPKRIKEDFVEYEIFTVREMGWNGKKNGELLSAMKENGFRVILTFDKNMQYQQSFSKYGITALIINAKNNDYNSVKPYLIPAMKLLKQKLDYKGIIVDFDLK